MRYKKKNYVSVSAEPRRVRIISSTKICPNCCLMCMEEKAIFPPGGAALYYRMTGKLPMCKVTCQNDCHLKHDNWGWEDVAAWMKRNRHKHLQWK